MKSNLKLKRLELWVAESYEKNPGQFCGTVTYQDSNSMTKLNLDAEMATKVLQIVAAELVESSRRLAQELTVSCIDLKPVIEFPRQYDSENSALDTLTNP